MNAGLDYSKRMYIFFISALASIIGIAASYILFQEEASIISVFLTSFALLGIVNRLFDTNRKEIWEKICTPYQANKKLCISLMDIFLGILSGYGIVTLLIRPETAVNLLDRQLGIYGGIRQGFNLTDIDFGTFQDLLKHNFSVLLVVFLFAIMYRTGGILLVIAWNASTWGAVFSYIARNSIQYAGIIKGLKTLLVTYISVFLHLVTESGGYILAAMAGFFISKACVKYFKDTERLIRVIKAAILIFILAVISLAASAFIECNITPKIIRCLLKT